MTKEFEQWQVSVLSSFFNDFPRELGRIGIKMYPSSMVRFEPLDADHFSVRLNFGLGAVKLIIPYFVIRKENANTIAWSRFLNETANVMVGMTIQQWQIKNGFDTNEGVQKIKW